MWGKIPFRSGHWKLGRQTTKSNPGRAWRKGTPEESEKEKIPKEMEKTKGFLIETSFPFPDPYEFGNG
jgi:hypothetical protein